MGAGKSYRYQFKKNLAVAPSKKGKAAHDFGNVEARTRNPGMTSMEGFSCVCVSVTLCVCVCVHHHTFSLARFEESGLLLLLGVRRNRKVSGLKTQFPAKLCLLITTWNMDFGPELRELSENSFFGSHLDIGPFCA